MLVDGCIKFYASGITLVVTVPLHERFVHGTVSIFDEKVATGKKDYGNNSIRG